MHWKTLSKPYACVCVCLLLLTVACRKSSTDDNVLQPSKYLKIELAATDTVAFVLSREAAAYDAPSFDGEKITTLNFGARVRTGTHHGDWIAVESPGSRSQNGYIHCAQLTGSSEVIKAIQLTGLMPKRILCLDSLFVAQKRLTFLGATVNADYEQEDEQVNVQLNLTKGTAKAEYRPTTKRISKFYLDPGDAIWLSKNVIADSIYKSILELISAEDAATHLMAGQLNCKTHTNTFQPMSEELSRLYNHQLRNMSSVMAFPAHPQLLEQPGQAIWLNQGKWLAVADRRKGVVLLSVDPLNRAALESVLTRDSEIPEFIIEHAGFLVIGWQGRKNSVQAYRLKGTVLSDSLGVETSYQPRSANVLSLGSFNSKLLVGTREGHLLCLDLKKETILSDTKISDSPISKIATSDRNIYAACGRDGIKILTAQDDYSLKRMAGIKTDVRTLELVNADLLVFSKRSGGLCFSSERQLTMNKFTELDTLATVPIHAIAKIAPPGETLARPQGREFFSGIMAASEQAIYLLKQQDSTIVALNTLPIPAKNVVCGIDLVAAIDEQSVSFISISDLLTSKYDDSYMAIYEASFQLTSRGSFELYNGMIGGYYTRAKDLFRKLNQQTKNTVVGNRMTILEREADFLCFGWTETRATRELVLGKGTQLSIGRGGANILGHDFEFGDIVEIADDAKPVKIGQWPLQSSMIAAKE